MLEISDRPVLFGMRHRRVVGVFDEAQQWSLEFCDGELLLTARVTEHANSLTTRLEDIQLPDYFIRKLYEAMREYYGDA